MPPMPQPLDALLPAETDAPAETLALGRRLADALAPGAVLALYGDLGAGKTHLVKGLCEGLGVDPDGVASPTFTLLHEYAGRLPVYHFDAYRLERPEQFAALGPDEYFDGGGVSVVEWPERVEAFLPADAVRLRLTHLGPTRRRIARAEVGPATAGTAEAA